MKKKIFIVGIILVIAYFLFSEARYNNIVKIEVNVVNETILTDKKDIRKFIKCINTKKRIKGTVSLVNTSGENINNNVIIYYKNGKSTSFLMLMDYIHNELICYPDEMAIVSYEINKKNTKEILELLNRNE